MHRRQEAVHAVAVLGETKLHETADDLVFQLLEGGDLGLQEQVAVLFQQRWQLVTADAAAVEYRERVAALVGQVLDQNEGEQRQALCSLVNLRRHLLGHEVIEAARVAHQLETEGAEQRTILVLHAGQLGVALRLATRDVITLEQVAEGGRELGHFFKVDIHRRCSRASVRSSAAERAPPDRSGWPMVGRSRVDDASSVHRPVIDEVDKESVVHPA